MLRALLSALVLLVLPISATAQDRPSAILVLDASGSMWGQIEGVNKIVIARDVVTDLLDTLPEDQALGLVAYGHRAKGDCNDIELIYQPGTDRTAIADAVAGLNPKGKTPLSAAVIQAAEALRYTEETATVILVSDGIETCDYDPCEVGRTLEQSGVDFTAHVIGFDVSDPEARAQLQCLAEETGGTFRSADDAGELADALSEVAAAPAPEPEPEPAPVITTMIFEATDGENGPIINDGLAWTLTFDGAEVAGGISDARPAFEMPEGPSGKATVTRLIDEATGSAEFTKTGENQVLTIALPVYEPPATLDAPAEAPAGSLVPVRFTGPDAKGDFISSAGADKREGYYDAYEYTAKAEDGVVMVRMPPVPGPATLRYVLSDGQKVLAERPIEVTPLAITLTPPEGATIGSLAPVSWEGPDYQSDYISVAEIGADDGAYINYEYTGRGNPMQLRMPPEPGTYELRYVLNASHRVAARSAPFEVGEVTTSVSGPAEAVAGSTIEVTWTGPDAKADYISIARVGDPDGKYVTYEYTGRGNPAKVAAPTEPGDYEIRYVLNQDTTILARAALAVTDVGASLTAPESAVAGTEVKVDWVGPDYQADYISVAVPDEPGPGDYETYEYTGRGNPALVNMPTEPGTYELRYVANGNPDKIIATRMITLTEAEATLAAAESAPAGGPLTVEWTGPDTKSDYLSIAEAGSAPNGYVTYEYTGRGNPATINVPTEPGTYELRYILTGKPDRVIATRSLTVTEQAASVAGPTSGAAGSEIEVTFDGPGYPRDFISLAPPDEGASGYEDYQYTNKGNPAKLSLPEEPGTYELRYILPGRPGDRVLARQTITVE